MESQHTAFEGVNAMSLTGGGARRRVLRAADLLSGTILDKGSVDLAATEYTLLVCATLEKARELREGDNTLTICKLPLPVLASFLSVPDLKALCKNHNMEHFKSRRNRDGILEIINAHVCDEKCEDTHAVLSPSGSSDELDVEDVRFASSIKHLSFESVGHLMGAFSRANAKAGVKVVRVTRSEPSHLDDFHVCVPDIPLKVLAPRLTIESLRSLCAFHMLSVPNKKPKSFYVDTLTRHSCEDCASLFFTLAPVALEHRKVSVSFNESNEPFLWEEFSMPEPDSFPPQPCTITDIANA
ncbi:hypothetical protein CVT24_005496, partial [Panaeolus cyanescens]